jgi:hypothetical protein
VKLKKIKTVAEIVDALRTNEVGRSEVELLTVDGAVRSVRVGSVHFGFENYAFTIHAETDREEANRYRVLGKVAGFSDQVDYFEDHSDACAKRDGYAESVEVTMESVKVMLNAAGEVLGEVGPAGKLVDHSGDDCPF